LEIKVNFYEGPKILADENLPDAQEDVKPTFDQLGLSEAVLSAVKDAGYVHPTPIQENAIPVVLDGHDVLGCAQTGTGKTAGFTLPMIDKLASGRARARMPRSLILEPTRELAAQVSENFETYGKNCRLNKALLIGGVSFVDQNKVIDRGADVLIATPGRLLDHFERGGLLLRGIEILVIDEADRMLDMGFIPDVERIVKLCNPRRQTLFFSATMSKEMRRIADGFLNAPVEIEVAPPASPAKSVAQSLVKVADRDKRQALRSLLRSEDVSSAFIFCNRKRDVDIVAKSLKKHGFNAEAMHGDMSQSHRTKTLDRFRNDEFPLLVCSDVTARGIDVQDLSHVFLFDVPVHSEDYVHRIGRTGRAGKKGRAFMLAAPGEAKALAAVERLIGDPITQIQLDGTTTAAVDDVPAEKKSRRRNEKKPREAKIATDNTTEVIEEKVESVQTQAAEKPKKQPAKAKPKNRRGSRQREDRNEPVVIGMGDHVPAFLMRGYERRDQK